MSLHNKLKLLKSKLLTTSHPSERRYIQRQIRQTEQQIQNQNKWIAFAFILTVITILIVCNS